MMTILFNAMLRYKRFKVDKKYRRIFSDPVPSFLQNLIYNSPLVAEEMDIKEYNKRRR